MTRWIILYPVFHLVAAVCANRCGWYWDDRSPSRSRWWLAAMILSEAIAIMGIAISMVKA